MLSDQPQTTEDEWPERRVTTHDHSKTTALREALQELDAALDAERYRWIKRHWVDEGDNIEAWIDAKMAQESECADVKSPN